MSKLRLLSIHVLWSDSSYQEDYMDNLPFLVDIKSTFVESTGE